MDRIPVSPPHIPGLKNLENRPLLSVMIPVYNCARFVPDVLKSVLCQDMGKDVMQIEVVDDASTDAVIKALVDTLGNGRVTYYRQTENVGSLRNFETCINRSQGKLVHILHGDDRVKPGFYERITSLFKHFPDAGAAFTGYSLIHEDGKWSHDYKRLACKEGILKNWLVRIAELQRIQYASMVVRRDVYEKLGGFYGMNYGEDWEMWVRIAQHYPVIYTPKVLAEYRMRKGSISSVLARSGESFPCLLNAHSIIQKQIMEANISEVAKKRAINRGKQHCALYKINLAYCTWAQTHDIKLACKSMAVALELNNSLTVYYHTLKFFSKAALDYILQGFKLKND